MTQPREWTSSSLALQSLHVKQSGKPLSNCLETWQLVSFPGLQLAFCSTGLVCFRSTVRSVRICPYLYTHWIPWNLIYITFPQPCAQSIWLSTNWGRGGRTAQNYIQSNQTSGSNPLVASRCWISYSGDQCQFAECPGTRQSMGTRLGHHSSGKWLWLEFIHRPRCHMSSYVHACLKEDANTIPLASCWPFVFIIVYIYIYIMFLSQSESLCLQVQEQKVDLNVIACSAVMSTRLSSSVWLQTSTCPWQALTCAARFVSSCFLFADPFRTVSFSTVGFTHDGTGCPQRFIDSISWFLTILGTFFFRHVTTLLWKSVGTCWYLYAVQSEVPARKGSNGPWPWAFFVWCKTRRWRPVTTCHNHGDLSAARVLRCRVC